MKKVLLLLTMLAVSLFICAQSWNLTGNAGTSPDSNFIGTTDAQALLFRVNNTKAGLIHPANNNTSFGLYSLYYNTTGYNNTATGSAALFNNTTGYLNSAYGMNALFNNTHGRYNTAAGAYALYTNNTGVWNTAIGYRALFSNTAGNANIAIGIESLLSNQIGGANVAIGFLAIGANYSGSGNVAVGDQSLRSNSTGDDNVAIGKTALFNNSDGFGNVGIGKDAMWGVTTGKFNTAVGSFSLFKTTISQYNTVVGYSAGDNYNMGWNNTILGANCDVNAADRYNCISIGQGVVCTGNSQARIGNSATVSIGGYVGWSNISDGRFKKNVTENVKGLDFIMKLQPVTYHLDISGINKRLKEGGDKEIDEFTKKAMAEKEKILFSGFIAQDVEKAAKDAGYDFSGVDKPQDKDDLYGLRYAEFVVPLVKGMQEQQQMILELKKQNELLKKELSEIKKLVCPDKINL